MQYPVKRVSLTAEVVNRLQQLISLGEYPAGGKLPAEPELMRQFGVGRSTIREAISILANTGLVRVQQGSGTFVEGQQEITEPLPQRLKRTRGKELNEVRQLLELKIAEKAALNRTEKDIARIGSFLEMRGRFALENKADECIQADIDFHRCIAEASKNDIMVDLYKTIANHLKTYFIEMYASTEAFVQTQDLHRSLMQAIIAKDPAEAWHWAAEITGQQLRNVSR